MWYQSLVIDRILEEQFHNRNLSSAESEFMRLIRMGILDGREGYDFPNDGFDAVDEALVGGGNEALGNVGEREGEGMFP